MTKPARERGRKSFIEFMADSWGIDLPDDWDTKQFQPYAFYNETGDMIQVYLENCPYTSEWKNPYVSIYWNQDRTRVVGFELACPKRILEKGSMNIASPISRDKKAR